MIDESKYSRLVAIYKNIEYAPLFFEELSSMRSPKPNIDIERRRMEINTRHRIKLPRTTANEFFAELEALKLGTLTIIKNRGQGNSKFKWTEIGDDVVSMAKEVQKRVKPTHVQASGLAIPLSTGRVLRLSRQEVGDLWKAIRAGKLSDL